MASMAVRHAVFLGACAALAACTTLVQKPALSGRWNGSGAELTIDDDGARAAFACGWGALETPISPGRDGRFSVAGSYTQGSGAPPPEGWQPPVMRARYSGIVDGERMVLSLVIKGETESRGPFTLVRDGPELLLRCP